MIEQYLKYIKKKQTLENEWVDGNLIVLSIQTQQKKSSYQSHPTTTRTTTNCENQKWLPFSELLRQLQSWLPEHSLLTLPLHPLSFFLPNQVL